MNLVGKTRAVPGTLIAMHRLLASKREGKCDRETLFAELLPPALRSEKDPEAPVGETLALGEELGLWCIEGSSVSVEESVRKLEGLDRRDFVAEAVFSVGREEADELLFRILAWMLAQPDPLGPALTPSFAETLVNKQSSRFRFNETTFGQSIHWGAWLGLVENESSGAGMAARPDPTRAVRRAIEPRPDNDRKVPITEFIADLGRKLPVLDGGWARVDVESECPGLATVEGHVSPSLSLALCRLEVEGSVELSAPSDAPAMLLQLPDGTPKVAFVRTVEAKT